MKKIIYYLSTIFILFTGCVQDEKDLFDDPSSIRLQKSLDECREILLSAENGWIFEYFPTTNYRGGYIFNADFTKDYEVTLSAEDIVTMYIQYQHDIDIEESTSTFALKKDDGPVLSFDTYNPFIHTFAEPMSDGYGLRGDYEFLIIEATSDRIKLKGKKRKDYSVLYKVPENMSGVDYRNEIMKNDPLLFPDGRISSWYLTEGNDTLYIDGLDRFFQTSYTADFEDYSYLGGVPTLDGIHFSPGINFKGKTYEYFTLAADKNSLISKDDDKIVITSIPIADFFDKDENWRNNYWEMTYDNTGGAFASLYQKIATKVADFYNGEKFEYFALQHVNPANDRERDNRVLSFTSGGKTGYFDIEAGLVAGTENEFSIKYLGTKDLLIANIYSYFFPEIEEFAEILEQNSPYIIENMSSLLNPSTVKLTSKANSNNWFIVELEVVSTD